MCGIVGIFDLEPVPPLAAEALRPALEAMRARGPDGQGIWGQGGCLLGHRRLAILDLEGGRQPWEEPGQSAAVLTYNGELYNYRDLRIDLAAHGYRFRSDCDTEVVFAAWEKWGPAALQRFNGIFAFGIFDGRDRLALVRDPLGVKPLYYTTQGGRLYFASSVAALLSFPEIPRRLDPVAAAHYLATARTNLADRTLLAGIHLLPPGHLLEVTRGSAAEALVSRPYWELPAIPEAAKAVLDKPAAREECAGLLRSSVHRQLQSDVPVGAFLSGGLDSSILLALSREVQGEALGSYGVEFSDGAPSEREGDFMRLAAKHLETRFHLVELRQESFDATWGEIIEHQGLPLSTPNEVAINHLARALREHYTVALGGEGADEIFGGYMLPYASAWDYERSTQSSYSAVLRQRVKEFYGYSVFPHQADHHLALNVWMPPPTVSRLLGRPAAEWESVRSFYVDFLDRVAAASPLDRCLHLHRRVNLEGLLLRLDANTMAASVEARVPYTDRALVEWANRIPIELLMRRSDRTTIVPGRDNVAADWIQRGWVDGKWVLRESFRHRLPEAIVNRPKASFPTPFETVLAAASEAQFEWIKAHNAAGIVSAEAVEAFWRETEMPGQFFRRWPLVNLLRWADQWKVRAA